MQPHDHPPEVGGLADLVDLGEQGPDGLDAALIDPRLIHAPAVEVTDQLLDARARPVLFRRDLLEDLLEPLLGILAGLPAPAPPLHRRRDRVLLAPRAVRELVEVRAWIG